MHFKKHINNYNTKEGNLFWFHYKQWQLYYNYYVVTRLSLGMNKVILRLLDEESFKILLTAIYTNNNHIHSDDWVFGIVDSVYSVRNKNIPINVTSKNLRLINKNILQNIA